MTYLAMEKTAPPGDREILRRLLDHSGIVFRICLGFSANASDAEELCQDVYLKAWSNIDSLHDPGSARPWLFRIARNTCLNHLRKKLPETRFHSNPDGPFVELNTPEKAVLDGERRRILKDAVRDLSGKLRSVFVLREYGGLSYLEIAESLGIKEGTVMSRLKRARKTVTDRLKEKGYGT